MAVYSALDSGTLADRKVIPVSDTCSSCHSFSRLPEILERNLHIGLFELTKILFMSI